MIGTHRSQPMWTGDTAEAWQYELIDRRRPKVEARPYMRWRGLIWGFVFSTPIWALIILAIRMFF